MNNFFYLKPEHLGFYNMRYRYYLKCSVLFYFIFHEWREGWAATSYSQELCSLESPLAVFGEPDAVVGIEPGLAV